MKSPTVQRQSTQPLGENSAANTGLWTESKEYFGEDSVRVAVNHKTTFMERLMRVDLLADFGVVHG